MRHPSPRQANHCIEVNRGLLLQAQPHLKVQCILPAQNLGVRLCVMAQPVVSLAEIVQDHAVGATAAHQDN